jgi:hypothetical protein
MMILEGYEMVGCRVMSCSVGDDPSVLAKRKSCWHLLPNQAGGGRRIRKMDDAVSVAGSVPRT